MLNINDTLVIVTGHRTATVCVVEIVEGKAGRVLKLKRVSDAGGAPKGFPYAELRWSYSKQGDFTFILEQFAEGRRVF